MSSTLSIRVRPETKCRCGSPLSNVKLAVDGDSDSEFTIPDTAVMLVTCPRCGTTKPMPLNPDDWRVDE